MLKGIRPQILILIPGKSNVAIIDSAWDEEKPKASKPGDIEISTSMLMDTSTTRDAVKYWEEDWGPTPVVVEPRDVPNPLPSLTTCSSPNS